MINYVILILLLDNYINMCDVLMFYTTTILHIVYFTKSL